MPISVVTREGINAYHHINFGCSRVKCQASAMMILEFMLRTVFKLDALYLIFHGSFQTFWIKIRFAVVFSHT